MSYQLDHTTLSFPAAIDLSGFQFYPVTLTTAGITTIGATATRPIGVLQDTPTAGNMASVCIAGVTKMVAYTGAIARLDALGVNTNGVGAVTTTDNQWIVGTHIEDAAYTDAGVNTIITVNVNVTRY